MTKKYMRMLLVGCVSLVMVGTLVACGDDTMNSATDGTKTEDMLDNTVNDMYDDEEKLMDDVENGVDDVINGTKDVIDDIEDTFDGDNDSTLNEMDEYNDTYETQLEVEDNVVAD